MTIIFLRHGETLLNAARVLQPAHTPLGPRGHAQAEAVAQRIAALQPAAILSSDLPRALQTAHAVATATGLPVQTHPLLQERHFGHWRGQPLDSFGFDPLVAADAPPGGESAADFDQRVRAAFALTVEQRSTLAGPLLVVTHGLWIRSLLERVLGAWAEPESAAAPRRLGNTSVTVVSAQPPHRVNLLNCTRHLDALGPLDDGCHAAA